MLERERYFYLKEKISSDALSLDDIQELNSDFLNVMSEHYLDKKYSAMVDEITKGKRFESLLSKCTTDQFSLYIGMLKGIIGTFEALVFSTQKLAVFYNSMTALYEKANYNKVVNYLYDNPDIQHKVISENLNLNKGYLSQILKELETVGCVERYASGKRSFFSLSLNGQAFVKKQLHKKTPVVENTGINSMIAEKYKEETAAVAYLYPSAEKKYRMYKKKQVAVRKEEEIIA